jgi:ATP-dependent Lon protease
MSAFTNSDDRPTVSRASLERARNERDLAELPPEVMDTMRFVPVSTIEEVLAVALPQVPVSAS